MRAMPLAVKPDVALYAIGADGSVDRGASAPAREAAVSGAQEDRPDLVILRGPFWSAPAQEAALRIARGHKQALLIALCDCADGAPAPATLQALHAACAAVLMVGEAGGRDLAGRLLRTICAAQGMDQWLACAWDEIRYTIQAAGSGLAYHGSGCGTGPGCAALAATAATRALDAQACGWRMAGGICIGIRSSSKERLGADVQDVLRQLRAGLDPGVTITLSAGYDGSLDADAVEIDLFVFGRHSPAPQAGAGAWTGGALPMDTAALAWRGDHGAQDPLYPHACALVLRHGYASVSLVQRHLRIGYGRACRLVDAMEDDDLLSATHERGEGARLLPELG